MAAPVSVLSFHYKKDFPEEWVCVPSFLRAESYPEYIAYIRRNVASLEDRWGDDAAQRILQRLSEDADPLLEPTCVSLGLEGATHEYVIHEVLEMLVRRSLQNARFGGDTLFLYDVAPQPKWQVARRIDTLQRIMGTEEHAMLGVWPVMPVFAKIVVGLADAGRRPGWLPKVWDRMTEEERADVAGALRNERALAHISCSLDYTNLAALNALVAGAGA